MLDRRIAIQDATPVGLEDQLATVRSLLSTLQDFAIAGSGNAVPQHDNSAPAPHSLAARYAAANSITRRRFDAILREGETIAQLGFAVIGGRPGRSDPGTIAAARFLGKRMTANFRRLENLLMPHAI